MDIQHKIGSRMRYLRTKNKMSQEDLAHAAGLDRTYINSIENGRRNVSIANIERIANALDISLSDFFGADIFGMINE